MQKSFGIKQAWQTFIHNLNSVNNNTTEEELGSFLDVEEWIDTMLFCQLVFHTDSWSKNHIYTTWDGTHWSPLLYDFDACLGVIRNPVSGAVTGMVNPNSDERQDGPHRIYCASWLPTLESILGSSIAERYRNLRSNGIITYDRYEKFLLSWEKNIGIDAYKDDDNRWQYPSLGHIDSSIILTTKMLLDWFRDRISYLDSLYNFSV
jgi:hypothetical protein